MNSTSVPNSESAGQHNPGISSRTVLVDDGRPFKDGAARTPFKCSVNADPASGNFVKSREDLSVSRPRILCSKLSVPLEWKYLAPIQLWL